MLSFLVLATGGPAIVVASLGPRSRSIPTAATTNVLQGTKDDVPLFASWGGAANPSFTFEHTRIPAFFPLPVIKGDSRLATCDGVKGPEGYFQDQDVFDSAVFLEPSSSYLCRVPLPQLCT